MPPDEGLDGMEKSSSSSSSSSEDEKDSTKKGIAKKDSIIFGEVEKKLYTSKSLFREVDKLLGVQNQHYANIS